MKVLVTGMSGTGKSSALAISRRRGFRVVDTDDPGWREYREYVDSSDESHRGEWLWAEERMTQLLDSDDGRSLFVAGCVRNQTTFYDRFDAVVLLSAPADGRPASSSCVQPALRSGSTFARSSTIIARSDGAFP